MLVAAMNPCACGYLGDARHECRCTPAQIQRYRARMTHAQIRQRRTHENDSDCHAHLVKNADRHGQELSARREQLHMKPVNFERFTGAVRDLCLHWLERNLPSKIDH
jgi:magnesium chelatase family protein